MLLVRGASTTVDEEEKKVEQWQVTIRVVTGRCTAYSVHILLWPNGRVGEEEDEEEGRKIVPKFNVYEALTYNCRAFI